MDKLLSIIIPSYNMEQYLPKCCDSLLIDDKELFDKLDVIIVNDGSTDRTSEIAHSYEAKYPGVFRVIDKPNGHYGSCINAGLASACGIWIKVLDADDWFNNLNFAEYLKLLFRESEKGESAADLVVNDFEFVSEHGRIRKKYDLLRDREISVGDFDFSAGRDLWMHAVAYRTEKLKAIGYEQLTGIPHTDIQWLHLPMSTVSTISSFPEILYEYQHLREGNTSSPDEFYRTYWVQVRILKQMIEDYEMAKDRVDKDQSLYLLNHLRYRSMRAYRVHLVERSPLLKCGTLEDFDDYLKGSLPALYHELDQLVYSNELNYRYVHAWRRKKRITLSLLFHLMLCRCASSVLRRIRRLV